jgi:predicted PurR-regulated permease PerM
MAGLLEKVYNAKWIILGVALVLLLLWIMRPFLDVFVYAIFVYYITRPIKRKVQKYIKNDGLAATISLLLLGLPLILIISYTLLFGISQLMSLIGSSGLSTVIPAGPLANATAEFTRLQQNLTSGTLNIGEITSQNWYRTITSYSWSLPSLQALVIATGATIADLLFKLFIILFIALTLLKDDTRIKAWFEKTFPTLIAENNRLFARYMGNVDEDLQKIFFSNLLSIVFFAIIAVIAYQLVNMFAPVPSLQIPAPILLGILTGVCALIPIVGMWLVVGPLFLYLIVNSLSAGTLFPNIGFFIFMFLFIFIFVTTLPGFVVGPYLARGKINTGLLMFAYIIGPLVFGISGIFLGAIVLVLLTHYFSTVVPEFSREHHEDIGTTDQ